MEIGSITPSSKVAANVILRLASLTKALGKSVRRRIPRY